MCHNLHVSIRKSRGPKGRYKRPRALNHGQKKLFEVVEILAQKLRKGSHTYGTPCITQSFPQISLSAITVATKLIFMCHKQKCKDLSWIY